MERYPLPTRLLASIRKRIEIRDYLPSLGRLIEPRMLPFYEAAYWLVTGDPSVRHTGRTPILAAAFLREACRGRSARLWDHAAAQNQLGRLKDQIWEFANALGVEPKFDSGQTILRGVDTKDIGMLPQRLLLQDDDLVILQSLRRSVENALRGGFTPDEVVETVKLQVNETVVEETHDL